MKSLNHRIIYNNYNHWECVEEICEIAKSLQPEQTLRVYLDIYKYKQRKRAV
jgi:hypothetical protein